MSIRDNCRTKEEILKSNYITIAELGLFESMKDYADQAREYEQREFISREKINPFELLDLD